MAKSKNPSVWIERRRTKAGETKYRVRSEVDGRRLPASPWTPKRTYADEEAAKIEAKLWAGERDVVQRRRQIIWDTFAESYLKHSEDSKSRRTYLQFDKPAVDAFTKKAKGFPLASITTEMIVDWLIGLRKEGYNDTSRKMMFGALSTAFNYAVKTKLMGENPMRHATRPTSEESGRELTDAEIAKLFQKGSHKLWRTGTFSVNTGLRISEVTGSRGLDWANVEVAAVAGRPPMPLAQALEKLPLKQVHAAFWFGRIPAQLRKTRRKVKKDCRFPINKEAKAVMGNPKAAGKVFPYAPYTVQHDLIAARKKGKLPEDIHFHCFRHTFATRYLARGGHIEDLLETKLWSTYDALLRYVHVKDDILARRFGQMALPRFQRPSAQEAKLERIAELQKTAKQA
ncbi:MAG: tyrosine-type recombinase/integrase [Elusimicrobiota bacterium]